MSQSYDVSNSTASPRRLLPERLSFILNEKPLLWFEDVQAYDALLSELVAEYDPQGAVEFMLVKDIADAQWECGRLRRMRRAAIEVEFPDAAHRLMKETYEEQTGLGYFEAQKSLEVMARHSVRGDREATEALDEVAAAAGVTYQMVHYETHKRGLKTITAIEEALSRAERRRDQVMHQIEDRRRTNAAMTRSLVKPEAAEDVALVTRGAGSTRASNRLSHGLRSRAAREARSEQAKLLAEDILSGLPQSAEIEVVAGDLAEAMLQLAAVRSASLALYATREDEAGEPSAVVLQPGSLVQYERKAVSRRNALVRRLDYLSLEVRRRDGSRK
jgi:hypothetical protein